MSKQLKYVKIICIVLVFSVLALALAVGFLATSILKNSYEPNPLDGYEEKPNTPIIPPVPDNENDELPFQVRSDKSVDAVYLRAQAFGNYDGKTWIEAVPYTPFIDGKYPATYLGVKQIEKWKLAEPCALEIVPNNATMVTPMYTATTLMGAPYEEEYTIPVDDVTPNGRSNEYYRMYYYDYGDISLKPSVAILEYESYEARYYDFVKSQYLNIDPTTKAYMLDIARQQEFNEYAYNLPERIAEYVEGLGTYSMAYNTQLDEEENVAIAFIEKYREGTCKHFASVATLLFRALNVPARYVVGYVTETEAGEWIQLTKLDAHAWVEFYVEGFGWKMLEVTPQRLDTELTINPIDVNKMYDGTPLIPEPKVEGFEEYEEKGYTYSAVISGERTEPGISASAIESFTVYDPSGVDVTSKFKFIFETGEILVYAGAFSLESDNFTYMYNGKPPISQVDMCRAVFIEGQELPEGYNIEIVPTTLSNELGEHPHAFGVLITDADGNDVTKLYKLVKKFGSVDINANHLVIRAGSASKVYDDTELTCNEYEIVGGSLIEGDTISAYTITGSQLMPGRSANVIEPSSLKIINANGEDVTKNYLLSFENGTLTVYFG